jgi:hypothetical protein
VADTKKKKKKRSCEQAVHLRRTSSMRQAIYEGSRGQNGFLAFRGKRAVQLTARDSSVLRSTFNHQAISNSPQQHATLPDRLFSRIGSRDFHSLVWGPAMAQPIDPIDG